MNILLTGASGFIGRRLIEALREDLHDICALGRVRPPQLPDGVGWWRWEAMEEEPPQEALKTAEAVIHLAGVSVARRWSPEVKQAVRNSRVLGTRRLVDALSRLKDRPRTLICASATGYYGDRGAEELTESSEAGSGFLPEVCRQWEQQAQRAEELGIRVIRLRIGTVLHPSGGAMAKLLPLFRLGLGGPVGSGDQWMSWIHREDLVQLIKFTIAQQGLAGAVNAVAPEPVTNEHFARLLGSVLRRPAILRAPAFALKVLYGEMACIVLDSQRVLPAAALRAGFRFRFPDLEAALRNLLAG